MPRVAGLLLCICLLFVSLPAFASGSDETPLGVRDFSSAQAHLTVTRVSPELTSISMESPAVATQSQIVDYQTYQSFGIPGEYSMMDVGGPTVPQVTRFYRIPNTGGADLVITDAEYDVVDNVNPFPVQPDGPGFPVLTRNETVFSTNDWYPANVAVMSDPMIMRDFRVVTVTMYPVQVNPVTHQARIYRNISVDVVANNRPGVNELLNPRRPSGAWAEVYRSTISNLEDNALDDMTTTPGSLMIITRSDSIPLSWADTLAEWKTRKGYTVTVDARSSWSPSQVYSDIHTAYLNANPPLEFVLLMGSPYATWGIPVDGGNYDHTFASMTSSDDIEDIGVGRIQGDSPGMLGQTVAKIMAYERVPHMVNNQQQADTMWFHKAYLLAGIGNQCAGNYLLMNWAKGAFLTNTQVDSITIATNAGVMTSGEIQALQTAVNNGIGFMLWRGSWEFEMPNNIADNTNPGGRFPITMTITCMAGEYAETGAQSPALDFICPSGSTIANPKGGVASMGTSTAGTENGANVVLAGGMIHYIADQQAEHLGTCVNGAKAELYAGFGSMADPEDPSQSVAHKFSRLFNMLGDPSMSIWTDVPKVLDVTSPDTLHVGARSVTVTVIRDADGVPVENALVVLWKKGPDSTWVQGFTNLQGHLTLPVSVNTPGNMYLTVTKRNCKPYLYTIPCTPVSCLPMYSSVVLDDDNSGGTQGNGDHIMNPGETIDLPVYIRNFGNGSQATGVSATVASSNPHVTVVTANASYPNIAPGDSALSATAFRIHVASDMQHLEQVLLTITITSSAGQTVGAIPLTCYAGFAVYMRHALSGTFNPGGSTNLTVVLKNLGTMPMNTVTGHLTPLSPFVQADVATASFGDIAVNALDSNSTSPFTISANSLTFRGLQAPMQLVLNTASGFADTVQFIVSVGTALSTDPTGPDVYGYYAYDNTDTSYEMHPTYNYVNISANGGSNLNLADPGDKIAPTPVFSAVRRLPFGFKFYGHVYDSITVCSNGWCAFGNQSSIDMFRNYAIPAEQAPNAMIAPYFDDLKTTGSGQGVWVMNDSTNHRYIIQWKAGAGQTYSTPLDFEVMLYDTTYLPTLDGNGQVVVQYNTVSMNLTNYLSDEPPGCTVGVQAPGSTVGLNYVYQAAYAPGAATVVSGRAILFSTEHRMMFGQIQGTIHDAGNSLPMSGVHLTIDGYAYHTDSDVAGHYLIPNVLIGTYTVRAAAHRYNDNTTTNVVVQLDSTATVNMSLTHPLMMLSENTLQDSVGDSPGQITFTISNPGNGPLDYSTSVFTAGGHTLDPWDSVGTVNVSQLANDNEVWGCEFMNDNWWVSGSAGLDGHGLIYRFDRDGNYVGSIPQPSTTMTGWFDMATDGQYLYGSDSHVIYGIDATGQVHDTIPSPLNPTRALAYDSVSHHFWIADYTSDIYELDRTGTIITRVTNSTGLNITGLAWYYGDPGGYKLYIFSRDGATQTRVTKMMTVSPYTRMTEIDLPAQVGDHAAGCTITPGWNGTLLVFGGLIRNANTGSRLAIHELVFNSSWMRIVPSATTIPGGGQQDETVTFNPDILRDATYHVDLHISSVVYDTTMVVPVTLIVHRAEGAEKPKVELPKEFALHQNYPNPFNPTTQIVFDLPKAEMVQLSVYNSLGQKVTTLLNESRGAGSYTLTWNARADNGQEVSTGVYFCQLKAGSFSSVKKMLLMR